MAFTGRQLLEISFSRHRILLRGGHNGLSRAIHWFHAIESVEECQFLQSGELVFLTGISVGSDAEKLLQLLQGAELRHCAGVVVNTGKYIAKIPEAAVSYADAHALPLFELPWDMRLGEVTWKIGEQLMAEQSQRKNLQGFVKKLFFSARQPAEDFFDAALLGHTKLPLQKQVMTVDFPQWDKALDDKERLRLEGLCQEFLAAIPAPPLFTWNGNELLFLLPMLDSAAKKMPEQLRTALEHALATVVYIGLGGVFDQLADLRRSQREAQFSLRFAHQQAAGNCVYYQDTNIFRLFDRVQDVAFLRTYSQEVLGDLLAYDAKNGSDFAGTLSIYLEENEDIMATIRRLFIHRNTLTYRLKRIEEITHCRMDDAEARLNFRLAFKMQAFLSFVQNDK